MSLVLNDFFVGFRDPATIKNLAQQINQAAQALPHPLNIMEVCGGHTHTIMRYALPQLLSDKIRFIHGPGCPVCIMPKERIDHAISLAQSPQLILVTLGDMLRVPGSKGSLAKARAQGADVRAVYSPLEALNIAQKHPDKQVVFFAIGFETTTPMTAALVEQTQVLGLSNLFFHINHVLVPPAVSALLSEQPCFIDALIAPSHVSVITGAKIYQPLVEQFQRPVVVSGFEPVDVLQSILQLVEQTRRDQACLEVQYSRAVNWQGNLKAQSLIERYFEVRPHFRWRGLGDIAQSALRLKPQWRQYDAEWQFADLLSDDLIDDHKLCICGDILRGRAKPQDCKVFAKGCDPERPLGSCMVSSEGACHAYYRYAKVTQVEVEVR